MNDELSRRDHMVTITENRTFGVQGWVIGCAITFLVAQTVSTYAADEPCSSCGPGPHWVDSCLAGNDEVDRHGAVVGIDTNFDCVADTNLVLDICRPLGPANNLNISRSGPLNASVNFPTVTGPGGHVGPDVIDTEIVNLCLRNPHISPPITLRAGQGKGTGPNGGLLDESLGVIVEDPGDNTLATSFFDVMFEVNLGAGVFGYNDPAVRVQAEINCVPPRARYIHITGCTPIYDRPPAVVGGIQIGNLVAARHGLYPLDHFMVWNVDDVAVDFGVALEDQFMVKLNKGPFHLGMIDHLANPASKEELPYDPDHHLVWYKIDQGVGHCLVTVTIDNQFGEQVLELKKDPDYLLVPARKEPHATPVDLDHFLCYEVVNLVSVDLPQLLVDQFQAVTRTIREAKYFCNPVRKVHNAIVTPIENPEEHLVFYRIENGPTISPTVQVHDQFVDPQPVTARQLLYLGVPSEKQEKLTVATECIPTLSQWGVAVMAMLVLIAGTIVVMRRRAAVA